MPPAGFELTISAGKWPHTGALDRVATGIGRITSDRPQSIVCVQTTLEIWLRSDIKDFISHFKISFRYLWNGVT